MNALTLQHWLLKRRLFKTKIASVREQKIKAFSRTSRLRRFIIGWQDKALPPLILRTNIWPTSAYRAAQAIAKRKDIYTIQPLIYNQATRTIVYPEMPGRTLRSVSLEEKSLSPLLGPIGSMLAKLHQVPVPRGLPSPTPWLANRRRQTSTNALKRLSPEFGRRALRLTTIADKLFARFSRPTAYALIHGDFQPSNILIGPDHQPGLIDYSLARYDIAAQDAATFCVHLFAMTRGHVSLVSYHRLVRRFIRAYFNQLPPGHRSLLQAILPACLTEQVVALSLTTLKLFGANDRNALSLLDDLYSQPWFPRL